MSEIVARLVVLDVVFELVLGRSVLLLIALLSVAVAIAASIAAVASLLSLEDGTSQRRGTVLALRRGNRSAVAVAGRSTIASGTLGRQVVVRWRLEALSGRQIVVRGRLGRLVGGQVLVLGDWRFRMSPGSQADEQSDRCKALRICQKESGIRLYN